MTGAQHIKRTRLACEPAGFVAIAGYSHMKQEAAEMWSGKEEEEKDDASVISDMRSSHPQSTCVKPCSPDHD